MTAPRCTASNRRGQSCRARPLRGGVYCFMHDPSRRDEQAQAREAGRRRQKRERLLRQTYDLGDLQTPAGQLRLLEIVQQQALPLSTSAAGVTAIARTIHEFRPLYELAQLERRLRQLETENLWRPM